MIQQAKSFGFPICISGVSPKTSHLNSRNFATERTEKSGSVLLPKTEKGFLEKIAQQHSCYS